jgi:hypothetical protein
MFEDPEATENDYLKTKANLGSHNLSGAVFDAAPGITIVCCTLLLR